MRMKQHWGQVCLLGCFFSIINVSMMGTSHVMCGSVLLGSANCAVDLFVNGGFNSMGEEGAMSLSNENL